MPVFTKSDEYFLKEKEKLMRIDTKNKIAYGEQLPTLYNNTLKQHIQKTLKEEFI